MIRYIAIDTSDWPNKTAIHVLQSKKNKLSSFEVEGGYRVLYSTSLEKCEWSQVAELVNKVKGLYKIPDKLIFNRNVKENLGIEKYEQFKNANG